MIMIAHDHTTITSQNFNIFKMLCPQYISQSFIYIINLKFNKYATSVMYFESFENQEQYLEDVNYSLLEKSQYILRNYNNRIFGSTDDQFHLEDVFSVNDLPNGSYLTNSPSNYKSIESASIPNQFYGDSMDCYLSDNVEQESQIQSIQKLPALQISPKIAEQLKPRISHTSFLMEPQSGGKESEPYNSHDQTKNVPKNYIKAIFSFILDNYIYLQRLFLKVKLTPENNQLYRFLEFVKTQKVIKKYTIERLKSLWTNKQNGKAMRIISFEFLRRRSLQYIFGSKIEKKFTHIKHRYKLIKSIENPNEFTSIK